MGCSLMFGIAAKKVLFTSEATVKERAINFVRNPFQAQAKVTPYCVTSCLRKCKSDLIECYESGRRDKSELEPKNVPLMCSERKSLCDEYCWEPE